MRLRPIYNRTSFQSTMDPYFVSYSSMACMSRASFLLANLWLNTQNEKKSQWDLLIMKSYNSQFMSSANMTFYGVIHNSFCSYSNNWSWSKFKTFRCKYFNKTYLYSNTCCEHYKSWSYIFQGVGTWYSMI